MNPTVFNVAKAIFDSGTDPMLGPGAFVIHDRTFEIGKAVRNGIFRNYASCNRQPLVDECGARG